MCWLECPADLDEVSIAFLSLNNHRAISFPYSPAQSSAHLAKHSDSRCWESWADGKSFEVVVAFHDRRSWHVRADLFADGEYIDGRRFQPGCLRPWTFDKISQHQDDVVYRSKLAFGKIVNTRHRLRNWVDEQELTEEEHEAIPIQKLQELGEIRVTFKPGKIQMRHVEPPRGPRRHNDGHTGPKKVYERHKKVGSRRVQL